MCAPILAAGLSGFAFFLWYLWIGIDMLTSRITIIFMTLLSGLALLAFIIDMILFGIARRRYRNAGQIAQYGTANWLTLGALVALLLGFCVSACGVFGRHSRKQQFT